MDLILTLEVYAVALVLFLAIDLLWLGIVARTVYRRLLGPLLRDPPRMGVAFLFYAIFVAGLVYFAIGPGVEDGDFGTALLAGALYGFFTYATFDLTCLAVLDRYPAAIVPIDMAWGTALGASVASGTWFVADRFL